MWRWIRVGGAEGMALRTAPNDVRVGGSIVLSTTTERAMADDRMTLDVRFHVKEEQAAALMAMFDYWTLLGAVGSSRSVSFYVDGDGDFQPRCQHMTSRPVRLDDEMRKASVVRDDEGNRDYDYDPIYGLVRQRKEEWEARVASSGTKGASEDQPEPGS